jgi:RNA 2',3'-cyclic 3'-phosphodiesterase
METPDESKSARVFFALWPDANERAELAAWQPALQELCGGKIMCDYTLHTTLVFLGDIKQPRLEALQLAAQEVRGEPFGLSLEVAHYWGRNHIVYAAPRVIPSQLTQLVHDLEQCLSKHHFRLERHPVYKPHVTLLRHAKWTDAPLPGMRAVTWRAESFALMQSLRDDPGARYERLASFPLRAA